MTPYDILIKIQNSLFDAIFRRQEPVQKLHFFSFLKLFLLFNGTVAGCGSLSGGRLRRVARGREAEGAEGRSEARDFSARRARRLGVDEDLRSWVEEPPEVAS